MTLPYKYPDGRESRHVRYKLVPWGTLVGVFDLSLQYRTKGWWRYRWHTVLSVAYYPGGEMSLESGQREILKLAEERRLSLLRLRKFYKHLVSLNSE